MKKTVFTIFLFLIILISVFSIPVFSSGESSFAESAPGGTVSSLDDIKTVFGGDGNIAVSTEGEEIQLEFKRSVKLSSPVIIKSGTYRIHGMDCTLFRGFENGSLILLDGSEGGAPKLIIDEKSMTDWETGKTAIFNFDGNKSEFPSAFGALISLKGNAAIDFNGKVLFKNAINTEFGGAIYAEAVSNGSGGFFSPSLKLNYSKIIECKSLKGGGGIALIGGKGGEGEAILTDVIIEKNEALSDSKNSKGGAVYTNGGKIKFSGDCQILSNSADLGGAVFIGGFSEFEAGLIKYNSATVSGGALYCGADLEKTTSGTVAMNNTVLSYNTSNGNGGAITNEGTLLIGGSTYLTDNEAKGDGGGVYNLGSFGFSLGDIISNKAEGKAGAVYNGQNGILIISGGRISSNDASLCGGIYSEGVFEFKGGSIGKSIGAVPQNLVSGVMKMSDAATFTDTEVLGILIKKDSAPAVISVDGKLLSRVKQTVAFFEEITEADGKTSIRLANESGMQVFFSENVENLKSAVSGFKVYGEGLKNFKIKSDGTLAFRLPLMPLWGWILTLIGVAGATAGVIFTIKKLKKSKKKSSYSPAVSIVDEQQPNTDKTKNSSFEN